MSRGLKQVWWFGAISRTAFSPKLLLVTAVASVLTFSSPVSGQDSEGIDPVQRSLEIASDAAVGEKELARHMVALDADDIAGLAEIWFNRVQSGLAEIATLAGALETVEPGSAPALAAELSDANRKNIQNFERYIIVLSGWARKGGSVEDLDQHWDYVSGFIGELVLSFRLVTTGQLVWEWIRSARGGLRALSGLFYSALIVVTTWLIARGLSGLTRRWQKRRDEDPSIGPLVFSHILFWTIMSIGIFFALWRLGIDNRLIVAFFGGVGFLIAFVLQNFVRSVVAGALLRSARPYAKGDIVSINNILGRVEDVNLVSTRLRTFDNREVHVPNQAVWQGATENHTRYPVRRVDLVFGIGYGADTELAKATLAEIVREEERCLTKPETRIFVGELGQSSVNVFCRPWVRTADYWDVYWALTEAGKSHLQQAGIAIAYTQQDVNIRSYTALPPD